ncbi:ATP-binding protein [Corynebacterium aurimucosum]|uniref:ATP-binding protein n=1 Tax=Corynebacterium aurimucosum TaxID=169292 RepID=UPI0018790402|nr:ATP-binding protein [Corynebacterium aurimucosum]MBE7339836.1 ATP-binding protein [Corynebacterium aurimucosum]
MTANKFEIVPEIQRTVALPPKASINAALGANHDIRTGLDELVDNSIDAGASMVAIILHTRAKRIVQLSIHDDGVGMSKDKLEDVLRLGGHEAHSEKNIGRYGMGLKEGSFSNADETMIVSRVRGQHMVGYQLSKTSFDAGLLSENSCTQVWNTRPESVKSRSGTSIVWTKLPNVYAGTDDQEAGRFLNRVSEGIRLHLAIRYHRFIEDGRLKLELYSQVDDMLAFSAGPIRGVNPFGYRRSARKQYPLRLTINGDPEAPGITAHLWVNRSKTDEFNLEGKDELGHQGFYFYDADRLITQGGWSSFRSPHKQWKLARFEVDDPRVIENYLTISPQKGSVRLHESFYSFVKQLRNPDDTSIDFERVLEDSASVIRAANKKSGKPDPLADTGRGIARSIQEVLWASERTKSADPINVAWGEVGDGGLLELDHSEHLIIINEDFRAHFTHGHVGLNDAPVLKTLLYLLFNHLLSSGRWTGKSTSNADLWIAMLNAALEEELDETE